LSACAKPPPEIVVRTVIARPKLPGFSVRPCDPPVRLPDSDLPAEKIVPLWGADRAALKSCEARRAAAVKAVGG